MLIDALHAALEDRIETFHGVGGDDALAVIADVFLVGVVDGEVRADTTGNVAVPVALIRH